MKTYHLTHNDEENRWEVSPEKSEAVAFWVNEDGSNLTKNEAIQHAADMLKEEHNQNGYPISLRIHNKSGGFSKDGERTYGGDPSSSTG